MKGLRTILLVTGLYVLAHTILYTYIAPVLAGVGLGDQVQWVLLDFGIASIASIWLTGLLVDRHHRKLVVLSTVSSPSPRRPCHWAPPSRPWTTSPPRGASPSRRGADTRGPARTGAVGDRQVPHGGRASRGTGR